MSNNPSNPNPNSSNRLSSHHLSSPSADPFSTFVYKSDSDSEHDLDTLLPGMGPQTSMENSSPYARGASHSSDPFAFADASLSSAELHDLQHSYGSPMRNVFGSPARGQQQQQQQHMPQMQQIPPHLQSQMMQQQQMQQVQQPADPVPIRITLRQRLDATANTNYNMAPQVQQQQLPPHLAQLQRQQQIPPHQHQMGAQLPPHQKLLPPHLQNQMMQQQQLLPPHLQQQRAATVPATQPTSSLPPHVISAASSLLPPHLAAISRQQQQTPPQPAPQKTKPVRPHPTKASQPKKRQNRNESPKPASEAEYFNDSLEKRHTEAMTERYYRNQYLVNGYDLAKHPSEVQYIPQKKDHVYLIKKGYDAYREQMKDQETLWDKLYVGPFFQNEKWPFEGVEVVEAVIDDLKYVVKRVPCFYRTIQGEKKHGEFMLSLVTLKFVQVGTGKAFQMLYSELVGQVEWILHKPLMDAALGRARAIDAQCLQGKQVRDSVIYDGKPAYGTISHLDVAGSLTVPPNIESHLQDLWGCIPITFDDGSSDSVSPWELDSTNGLFQQTFKSFYKPQELDDEVRRDAIRELNLILSDRSIVLPLLNSTQKRHPYPLSIGTIIQRLQNMFYSSKYSFLNDIEHLAILLRRERTHGDNPQMDASIRRVMDFAKSMCARIDPASVKKDKKSSRADRAADEDEGVYQPPKYTAPPAVLPPHLMAQQAVAPPVQAAAPIPPPHMRLVLTTEPPGKKKSKKDKKEKKPKEKKKDKKSKEGKKKKDGKKEKKDKKSKESKKDKKKSSSTSTSVTKVTIKQEVAPHKEVGKITLKMSTPVAPPEPDPFEFYPDNAPPPPPVKAQPQVDNVKLTFRTLPPHLAAQQAAAQAAQAASTTTPTPATIVDKTPNRLRSLAPTPVMLPGRPVQRIDQYYTASESASPCLQSYNNFIETVHTPKRVIPPRFRNQQHKRRMKMEQLARSTDQQAKSVTSTITSFLGEQAERSPVPDIAALHQRLRSDSLKPVGFNVAPEVAQEKAPPVAGSTVKFKSFKWTKKESPATEDLESLNSEDVLRATESGQEEERIEHAWSVWRQRWNQNPPPIQDDAMEVDEVQGTSTGQLPVFIPLQHNLSTYSVTLRASDVSATMQDEDESPHVFHVQTAQDTTVRVKSRKHLLPPTTHVPFPLYEYVLELSSDQDVVIPVEAGLETVSSRKRLIQALPPKVQDAFEQCKSATSMFYSANIDQMVQFVREYGFIREFEWNSCGFLYCMDLVESDSRHQTRVRVIGVDGMLFRVAGRMFSAAASEA